MLRWILSIVSLVLLSFKFANCVHPYDKLNGAFSPNGELFQLEYARKACKLGSSAICGISREEKDKAILCLPEDRKVLSLLDPRHAIEKISRIDENVFVVCAGLVSDAQFVTDQACKFALNIYSSLSQPVSPKSVAMHIAGLFHGRTMDPRSRPFGVEAIVIGYDLASKKMELLFIDPSGEITSCFGRCIGKGSGSFQQRLEDIWRPEWKISDWLANLPELVPNLKEEENEVDGNPPDDENRNETMSLGAIFEISAINNKLKLFRRPLSRRTKEQ